MLESTLPKTYDSATVETKWYDRWKSGGYFKPKKGKANKAFSIIMPPPNVTGKLHMGHALDNTTQDALIRFKRMKGYETLWIPGCDHAGIATQSVVEKKVQKETGKTRHDIGREEFVKMIWAWKEEYGNTIVEQVQKMGSSCDWDYFTFTLDKIPNLAVKTVFKKMFDEGLIYQSDYIINWSPILQSAISDAEVDHREVNGFFYHILYQVKGSDQKLEVATTRPETLFGDTAVAVNPNDPRYMHLIGKTAIIPLNNREVPIIGDDHVDLEMGTGCLKVTPGHDFNDFEIGKRHNLPIINIINKDGTLNKEAMEFEGLTSKKAREKVATKLEELGLLKEKKPHKNQVGHCSRTDAVIEPMVSKQWFMNTEKMAQDSVTDVEKGHMTFFPKGWENTYFSYQRNSRPWCVSRQLWWGHQIPVYTCQKCGHTQSEVETPTKCNKCHHDHFTQDPDVLDTWFSSGLWAISTLGWPDKEAMKTKGYETFAPTSTLITGHDIIFFWVARMMMMTRYAVNDIPFSHTYIHAIVRDKNGVKMSKSLGNVIDPLDIIAQYGTDAMRFTLAASSGYNRDINLNPEKIEGYRNFINKLWNAFRFIHPMLDKAKDDLPEHSKLTHHDRWILSELNTVTKSMNESMEIYRYDDACSEIYSFTYDKYCSWYIELSKNIFQNGTEDEISQRATVLKYVLKKMLALLHPFTPFITEEIWEQVKTTKEDLLIIQAYPELDTKLEFKKDQEEMNKFIDTIVGIRNLRQGVNLKPKDEVSVELFTDDNVMQAYYNENKDNFDRLAKVTNLIVKSKSEARPKKCVTNASSHSEVYLQLEGLIDLNEQIKRIEKELTKAKQDYENIGKRLSNTNFISNAPEAVVTELKEKEKEHKEKIRSLELAIKNFH
ncbi:MAG: valine--tRNA ligase [Bacteriovoracaceae bacterium]